MSVFPTVETLLAACAEYRAKLTQVECENAALKNAIAPGQENCDAEYERLREERDEAIAENAALRRLAAHRAVVIEHQMMTTSSYQITRFTDEDESIWDERVQRFMDADRAIINASRKEGGAS